MTTNEDMIVLMKRHKADIAPSTARTYASLLRNLYYKTTGKPKDEAIVMDWYFKQDDIIEVLADRPIGTRKTIFAALMALVGAEHGMKYRSAMMADSKDYQEWVDKQEKTAKQQENWQSYAEVKRLVAEYEGKAKAIMKRDTITPAERKVLVDWMLLAMTTGYYIPPRRSMDYGLMKFRNYDRQTDNFLDKNQFVFNKYKTAKIYNQQSLEIPKAFRAMITKYIKYVPEGVDTLLYDVHGGEMYSVKITQRLNALFGAKVSVSMLRHIFLTDKLGDVPRLQELEQLAEDMGHSRTMQMEYVKH